MGNSISKMIEHIDSIISKNRSSFSTEECRVLEKVKRELLKLDVPSSKKKLLEKREIVRIIVSELLKLLLNPKSWVDIKNIF
jgi:hypothetical protein